MMPEIVSY